ncbi:hypothetical protein NECAME_11032 [Necator americanus]|uniref:Uncharacterized protein n=1 Tax=Necator americanus TaxID=51031 RepID=W2T5Z1_NECAM|nr:hypothetical protein NECAME_11032 [Necator americanus]ETN77435.1 hypothetical protein NECAME_11032 [Necator americanus]
MGHDVTEKRVIDEVVIDDDEIEGTNTPSSSKTQPSPPKQPRFRTLPISGVSVRIDGEHTSTLQSDFHVSPDRSLARVRPNRLKDVESSHVESLILLNKTVLNAQQEGRGSEERNLYKFKSVTTC